MDEMGGKGDGADEGKTAESAFFYNRRKTIRKVDRKSEDYPARLLNISSPPKTLYVLGNLPDQEKPSVAIIGARVCSGYGRSMACYFAGELAARGVQIISGMARGIDGIGQWAALEGRGETFGVLGCGVDICYPKENRALYQRLIGEGGVLSEQPPGTPPKSCYFPARNRIISGLADLILVIEARERSGTQITVDMALEQGRDIAVVPGRVGDALSEGCNQMIRQGAQLVTNPFEVLEMLDFQGGKIAPGKTADRSKDCLCRRKEGFEGVSEKEPPKKTEKKKPLEKKENMVYSCLDLSPASLDEIVNQVSLSVPEVLHILLQLKLKGYVREAGKNCYIRGGQAP